MSNQTPLAGQGVSRDEASRVYDLLVIHAGMTDTSYHNREAFIHMQTTRFTQEYRFIGELGFGGKVRRRSDADGARWYVTCYQEDENSTRRSILKKTNAALAALDTEH